MGANGYPSVLRERLGDAGVVALSQVLAGQKDEIVTLVDGRFEDRLGHECGKLRGEMQALRVELRGEMHGLRVELRGEMEGLRVELRGEMEGLRVELRGEMKELRGEFRSEMKELRADFIAANATLKADLIKWSFLFWVGQAAFVLGMFTALRP